jgi:hypothetical protein
MGFEDCLVALGVPDFVGDVACALCVAEPAGALEHGCGGVHSHRVAVERRAGGLTRCLTGTAADVEHVIGRTHRRCRAEVRVVPVQFGVVEVGVAERGRAHGAKGP